MTAKFDQNALVVTEPACTPHQFLFCSRDPIGFLAGDWNLYRYVHSSPLAWVDPTGFQAVPGDGVKPIDAEVLPNKCACCCCPTKITATATTTNKSTGREYAQSVTITFSVTMEFKKAPADAKSTSCELAFLEFIDPASTDDLAPYLYPDSWFDYTRFPEGEWIDHVKRKPEYFNSWKDFESPESKKCNGISTWTGTDNSQQSSIKPGQKSMFWQLMGIRGGGDCNCEPPYVAVLTNIIYDPQLGNGDPQFRNYPVPWQNNNGSSD